MEVVETEEEVQTEQDPTPKLKAKDFAAKIKAKYPEYKDVDDVLLAQKMVEKYPDYKDQVDFTVEVKKKEPTPVPLQSSDGRLPSVAKDVTDRGNPLAKYGINAPVIPKEQQANQPVSTQVVQPKITATYNDFQAHNAERKEKKAKLVSEAIDNTARKFLKNKGIIKPEEEGKSLNLSQYSQLSTKKKELEEMVANGDATFAISKDGEVGLKKTTGFLESLSDHYNQSVEANKEAKAFTDDMDAAQRVEYLERKEQEQQAAPKDEYLGKRSSGVGSIGELIGENAQFMGKAAVGAGIGAAAIAAAPETLGASLTRLPLAMSFMMTAEDSKNQGVQKEVTERYYQLLHENPNADKVELMEQAGQGALSGGLTGILTNAAMMTGVSTPLSLTSKSVIRKAITKSAINTVYASGAAAAVEAGGMSERNLEGIKTTPTDIAKRFGETFSHTATTLGMLHVLTGAATGAFKLPKVLSSAIKYGLKDADPIKLKEALDANVKSGAITQEVADKTLADVTQYQAAVQKATPGLSPEAEASVAGLIQAKEKLIAEQKTKDSSAKPYYDEKIAAIDEQIQKIQNTGKPYAVEIDEVSGEKFPPTPKEENGVVSLPPDNFSEPITIAKPDERPSTEVTEFVQPNEPKPQEPTVEKTVLESTEPIIGTSTEPPATILNEPNETKATQIPNTEKETGASNGGINPPSETTGEGTGESKFGNKAILNRLHQAENIPEGVKKKFEEKGLNYEPQSHQEAETVGKAMVDQYGIDDAVTLAETNKFKGGVNSAIFAESLNRLYQEELNAKTPEAKLAAAKRFAEIGIRYDEFSRGQGRDISQIANFYKRSPLGIKLMEEAKRKENFDQFSRKKEQSWKQFFDEMTKDPEFEKEFKSRVSEELKSVRAEARKARISKVDKFFDDAIDKLNKGGMALSTVVPIPPKVLSLALEGMKKAYHAGEHIAKIIEDAIDYINKEVGGGWDKDAFRKEWEGKLGEKETKEIPADKKEKMLERFRNKLKGLSEKEKDEVIRRSFKKLVENKALEYEDFKKIIGEVLGYGEMTPEQVKKLTSLVEDINAVDELGAQLRENDRSESALAKYKIAQKKAEISGTELGKLLHTRVDITQRLLSIMQLNTLTAASLVNNPLFNIFNQSMVRLPRSVIMSAIDQAIYRGGKLFGKDIKPTNDIIAAQTGFYGKLAQGAKQAGQQFRTGLTNKDYFQKEVYTAQIHPATAWKELIESRKGEKKLTGIEVADKLIQGTLGVNAEINARMLNIGDKPQRFATEGGQAATFAKYLGLKGIDKKLFYEFPKEEAYRVFKEQGLSDEAAMKKAEEVQQRIIKEGEESVFQEDNLVNDAITAAVKKFGKFGEVVKTFNMPFVKIPLNAFWSGYNLVNPEIALIQSAIYAIKASKSKSALDVQQSKKWLAHAITGMAWMGITGALAKAGIINAANPGETTKKEREGEQNYEKQGTVNVTKLAAYLAGEDPSKVKHGLDVDLKWFGVGGALMGHQAQKIEDMTPEQREHGTTLIEDVVSNLTQSGSDFIQNGIFSNTGAAFQALSKGGGALDSYFLNLVNMGTNVVHPATYAQLSRAQLPYYNKVKADNFMGEVKNNMLARSSRLRELTGQYPDSKIGIWGDALEKKDNVLLRMFGISRQNDDNFAQPLYNDYKRTTNTKFFPPSVKPNIKVGDETIKLSTKETAELEVLVGQSRKQLVAPYINDMATFEGSEKKYSQLTDEQKTDNLNILYEVGFQIGKEKFLKRHPEYKKLEGENIDREIQKAEERAANEELRRTAKDKGGVE